MTHADSERPRPDDGRPEVIDPTGRTPPDAPPSRNPARRSRTLMVLAGVLAAALLILVLV